MSLAWGEGNGRETFPSECDWNFASENESGGDMVITEAHESGTTKLSALANYAWQVERGETEDVIDMYYQAARDIGCSATELTATRKVATGKRAYRLQREGKAFLSHDDRTWLERYESEHPL